MHVSDDETSRHIVFAEGRYSNGDGCEVPNATGYPTEFDDDDACEGYYRNIFFRASDDGGATWGPIVKV